MKTWQLQDAKNKLSELIEHAMHAEPQVITRRGVPAVVVMSVEEYNRNRNKPEKNFVNFLLSMPKLHNDDEELFIRMDNQVRIEEFG